MKGKVIVMQNSYSISKEYIKSVLRNKRKCKSDKIWTVDEIGHLLNKSDKFVVNSLIILYSYQTEDEQYNKSTDEANGVGFNAYDAGPLTDIYDFMFRSECITYKQINFVRKKLLKYRKQLTAIANHRI